MMIPPAIAQMAPVAAALVGTFFSQAGQAAAKKAGEVAWAQVEKLVDAVRKKFSADNDAEAQAALKKVEEKPEDKAAQTELADVLAKKATADPTFAQEMTQSVQIAAKDSTVAQFLTQVYGGEVKNIVNINQAGDLTFN